MFINIKNEISRNIKYINSSSIITIEIIDMHKRNERAAVKKIKPGASHTIEAETKNNIITNDRIIINGFSAYSFDSEVIRIHYGSESECLERLEDIQSSLNWLKIETLSDITPHGCYINPIHVIYLNIQEEINSHLRKNDTHRIECVLDHKYISSLQDFIPIEFRLDRLLNLEKSISQITDTPKSIKMFLTHIREKFESIMEYKKMTLFTGNESDCKKKLTETISFIEDFNYINKQPLQNSI